MTKVQNPIIGRARGSAGGMTFSKSLSKNVMRAKPFEVANPRTTAQVTQRNFFTEVSEMIQNFNPEQLRAMFPLMPKGMTRRNALSKQVSEAYQVVDGVKSVKTTDIVTLGNASKMDMGTTNCAISNGAITVELDSSVSANTEVNQNFFVAVLVNDTQKQLYFPVTNAKVETGELTTAAPSGWLDTDNIHAIPLITNAQAAFSGFGTMGVTKRPANS